MQPYFRKYPIRVSLQTGSAGISFISGKAHLEVFIPDPGNPEESLSQFQRLLNQTLETDKDNVHWLLDLNSFQSEDVILDVLKRFIKGAKYL